jgi:sortase (surface protein transpeptidase)
MQPVRHRGEGLQQVRAVRRGESPSASLTALAAVATAAATIAVGATGCRQDRQERPRAAGVTSHVSVPETVRSFRSVRDPLAVAAPRRLVIPSIGVMTPLERLGVGTHRTIEVPRSWDQAGWFHDGPRPGEPGSAVILGHVDSPTGPAVFTRLPELTEGSVVRVKRADGSTVAFRVTHSRRYPRATFPVEQVYWPTMRPELRLITCGGRYDAARGGYQDNIVVFAVAVRQQ